MRRDERSHDGLRMPRWMRRWVFVAGGACLLTGALWLIFDAFVQHEGPFGPEPHPLQRQWLIAHGAAGMLMLWVFGLVWLAHVRRGWPRRRNRRSGAFMVASMILLALSGWGLYYLGSETLRPWLSQFHWILGLVVGGWLPIHIWRGRRSARLAGPEQDV